jgi:hypothetical protein
MAVLQAFNFPSPVLQCFLRKVTVHIEVEIIRYISQHTMIPVQFVLHWGTEEGKFKFLGLGPFIIIKYVNQYDVKHLTHQKSDAVDSVDGCRHIYYISGFFSRMLAREN